MKKRLLSQLLIFIVLALAWFDLQVLYKELMTAKISGPLPVFPDIQIQLLQSPDPKLNNDALAAMQKSLLQYFAPDLIDKPWQTQYVFVNLSGTQRQPAPDIVITLSLPPDRGILTVLHKQNSSYVLLCYRDNLLPIIELGNLSIRDNDEIFFTQEYQDESKDANNETRILKVWGWKNNNLKILRSEEYMLQINSVVNT